MRSLRDAHGPRPQRSARRAGPGAAGSRGPDPGGGGWPASAAADLPRELAQSWFEAAHARLPSSIGNALATASASPDTPSASPSPTTAYPPPPPPPLLRAPSP